MILLKKRFSHAKQKFLRNEYQYEFGRNTGMNTRMNSDDFCAYESRSQNTSRISIQTHSITLSLSQERLRTWKTDHA